MILSIYCCYSVWILFVTIETDNNMRVLSATDHSFKIRRAKVQKSSQRNSTKKFWTSAFVQHFLCIQTGIYDNIC